MIRRVFRWLVAADLRAALAAESRERQQAHDRVAGNIAEIRIQSRTVTETPWTDLKSEEAGT